MTGRGAGSKRVLLVGNPTARSGKNAARIERAVDLIASRGFVCHVVPTLPGGATIPAVIRVLSEERVPDLLVAMGGDGTFREVAAGLMGSGRAGDLPLAMLPTGTANDQGRSFGLDSHDGALARNVEVALEGRETALDAGRILCLDRDGRVLDDTLFFDSAGWGISARILAARNRDRATVEQFPLVRDLYRDKLVYTGAALRVFLQSYVVDDKFEADVVADGVHHTLSGLTDLLVKGTRVYAGSWVFDRSSRHDDGLFEMVPFRGKRDWTSKALVDISGNPVTEEMLNSLGVSHSRAFSASRFEIRFHLPDGGAPHHAQIDGEEYVASERASIEVLPRAIRLVVPAEWSPSPR